MTIAHWCILIAGFMPIAWVGLAKARPGYNNHAPRAYLAKLDGWRARANWAQQNSWEAFPAFAAGVLTAYQLHAPQDQIDHLAMAFIGLRILYGVVYLLDWASVRSVIWAAAAACTVGLFFIGS